jgi:hypothetical protein
MPAGLPVIAVVTRIALTAALVVGASMATERAGPLLGALIITLPIGAGPSYFFLALDHPPEFIAASALGSLAVNAANGVFGLVYVAFAQRRGLVVSLASALAVAPRQHGMEFVPVGAVAAADGRAAVFAPATLSRSSAAGATGRPGNGSITCRGGAHAELRRPRLRRGRRSTDAARRS